MPTRRTSSHKSKLPAREQAICRRLKEARLRLGLSQEVTAQRVGVSASQISNLEKYRAPVRCDFALRFCREMIISEEWLATGKYAAAEDVLTRDSRYPRSSRDLVNLHPLLFRQCADLHSHPAGRAEPRTLFSEAYDSILWVAFREISKDGTLAAPRIELTDFDRPEFELELLVVRLECCRFILQLRAQNAGQVSLARRAQREFTRYVAQAADLIMDRCTGGPAVDWRENALLAGLLGKSKSAFGVLSDANEKSPAKKVR